MIRALKKYYEKCGISALGFKCKHYKECRSECEDKSKFTKAREPYIGKYYGKKGIPKLLFLSLDSGDEKKNPKRKTIEALREGNLKLKPKEIPRGRHWYKTHQFAWVIFDELNQRTELGWDIGNTNSKLFFEPATEIYKIMHYFAHTNSVKCSMNNAHAKQANKRLFVNCRGYILEEIKIFNPHILVTQGNFARIAIEEAVKNKKFSVIKKKNISKANPNKPDFITIEIKGDKPALWIHHYHPNNYGTFFKKIYNKYRVYAKEAAQFIVKNYPELIRP